MNKSILAVLISLFAGFAAAAIVFTIREPATAVVSGGDASDHFDQSAATDDRILALEAAVAEERKARQFLEDELQILYTEIERLSDARDEGIEQRVTANVVTEEQMEVYRQRRADQTDEGRLARLVEAGLSPDRAEWVLKRESELQMEAMQAQFDARRSGEPLDRFNPALNPAAALRAEIGDAQYEQYLEANNQSTTVHIGSVLESSPGQRAGLQPGDQIVAYGGTRVFNVSDLNQQTMLGEPGTSVAVDITRDGMPMQVVLPRGPIGVSTSRFRGRRQ